MNTNIYFNHILHIPRNCASFKPDKIFSIKIIVNEDIMMEALTHTVLHCLNL